MGERERPTLERDSREREREREVTNKKTCEFTFTFPPFSSLRTFFVSAAGPCPTCGSSSLDRMSLAKAIRSARATPAAAARLPM